MDCYVLGAKMTNEVTNFLRKIAKENNFTVFNEVSGTLDIYNHPPIKQSSGAVYGIFAVSEEPLSEIKEIKDHTNLYPVYWGSDVSPPSRIGAHAKAYKGTGNAKLRENPEIKGKQLIWGAIFVSDYKGFEQHLHKNFEPLIGTSRSGKSLKNIEVTG
jgi:hypothetical protein